jgi:hypothetical protein
MAGTHYRDIFLVERTRWEITKDVLAKKGVHIDGGSTSRASHQLKTDNHRAREESEKMADQHSEPVPGGMGTPTTGPAGARAVAHRPGMLTFAAIMVFVVAGFEALAALLAFAGTGWWYVASVDTLVYVNLVFWGILDLIIAAIALYAGIDILRGGTYGLIVGYVFAVFGTIRWLFVIPAAPILAVVVVALCVMIIYGLAKHSDYFEEAA